MVLLRSNKVTMEPAPKSTEAAEPTNPEAEPSTSTEGSVPFVPEPMKSTEPVTEPRRSRQKRRNQRTRRRNRRSRQKDLFLSFRNRRSRQNRRRNRRTRQKRRFRQKNVESDKSGGSAKSFANSGTDRRISADRGDGW
ncbi:unnamed protein product [Microthlaspi erraticum]|uniref:Uncharacterized protein n=1 Tax=Microthlaspi erraticum TaxID=1685480 RepID=A0A6D2KXR1_9BRAS|nr:unnamed protein product [Microthlaspi erraticum]